MKSLTIQHSTQLTAPLTYTKRGVLMLRGLGVKDPLHPDFTRLLTNQQLEVYTVERKRDQEILLAPMEIVQEYVTQTRLAIQELLDLGKEVHLMGISF